MAVIHGFIIPHRKTINMKPLFTTTLLFLIACNNAEKKDSVLVPGAYSMLSQSIKTSTTDTTYRSLKQLKIYTGEYMMYANFNPQDSVSSFGIGSYSADKDTVTENIIYNASDSLKNDSTIRFKLIISKTDSGYKQIIPDMQAMSQKITLTEEYKTVGTGTQTPLDGVWKESKTFYVKGKDTTKYNTTQFKAYYGNHFIWGHTYSDSAKRNHTGIGFGKFEMMGTNKLKESVSASSYYQDRGHDIDIDLEMNGNDEFKQTISYQNGGKAIEIYQRLK